MWPYPGAPKVLDIRPLPLEKLSGRRHVPILTHASGIPFLRFKKPQSPFLSRILRNKLAQKQRLFQSIVELDGIQDKVAAWEDQWDTNILLQLRQEGRNKQAWVQQEALEEPGGWRSEVKEARRDVWERINRGSRRVKETTARMMEIVDRERELYEQERAARRHAKQVEKLRKKEEEGMKGADTPENGDID